MSFVEDWENYDIAGHFILSLQGRLQTALYMLRKSQRTSVVCVHTKTIALPGKSRIDSDIMDTMDAGQTGVSWQRLLSQRGNTPQGTTLRPYMNYTKKLQVHFHELHSFYNVLCQQNITNRTSIPFSEAELQKRINAVIHSHCNYAASCSSFSSQQGHSFCDSKLDVRASLLCLDYGKYMSPEVPQAAFAVGKHERNCHSLPAESYLCERPWHRRWWVDG